MPRPRTLLVCSSGGHLLQLHAIERVFRGHDAVWVTFDKEDARSLLDGRDVRYAHHPTNRNLRNLARNTLLAFRLLRRERPDLIVSTGAGTAIPFFVLGRLFGAKLLYLEVFDRIDLATITGRICHRFAHEFALQWPEQQAFYPRGTVVGTVL